MGMGMVSGTRMVPMMIQQHPMMQPTQGQHYGANMMHGQYYMLMGNNIGTKFNWRSGTANKVCTNKNLHVTHNLLATSCHLVLQNIQYEMPHRANSCIELAIATNPNANPNITNQTHHTYHHLYLPCPITYLHTNRRMYTHQGHVDTVMKQDNSSQTYKHHPYNLL
jgi:hypothetical protein